MTWQSLGVLPTFNNFQGDLDRQDATFRVSIDFEAKPAGNREIVFETGGGGVGISLCYEAGNRLVLRASSNSGSGFAKLATTLGDEVIGAGEIEVMWSYQTSTGGSPQTIALWLDGRPVAEVSEILGDDWSGSGGASFGWQSEGVAGTVVGLALEGDRFVSGTINLDIGLEFFAQTLPVIESLGNPFRSAITDLRWIDATRSVHLEWTSMGGATYAVDRSEDLSQWTEIDDGVPSGGNITSFLDSSLEELPGRLYYRVRLVE